MADETTTAQRIRAYSPRAVKVADVAPTAPAEPTPDTETAMPAPEQFNAHDVKRLMREIDAMLLTLRGMGMAVDQGRIRAAADAQAACEILVAHGLASEEEVQARAYRVARDIVAQVLQQAEEQRLAQQQQARAVQAVRAPGIVVARH